MCCFLLIHFLNQIIHSAGARYLSFQHQKMCLSSLRLVFALAKPRFLSLFRSYFSRSLSLFRLNTIRLITFYLPFWYRMRRRQKKERRKARNREIVTFVADVRRWKKGGWVTRTSNYFRPHSQPRSSSPFPILGPPCPPSTVGQPPPPPPTVNLIGFNSEKELAEKKAKWNEATSRTPHTSLPHNNLFGIEGDRHKAIFSIRTLRVTNKYHDDTYFCPLFVICRLFTVCQDALVIYSTTLYYHDGKYVILLLILILPIFSSYFSIVFYISFLPLHISLLFPSARIFFTKHINTSVYVSHLWFWIHSWCQIFRTRWVILSRFFTILLVRLYRRRFMNSWITGFTACWPRLKVHFYHFNHPYMLDSFYSSCGLLQFLEHFVYVLILAPLFIIICPVPLPRFSSCHLVQLNHLSLSI